MLYKYARKPCVHKHISSGVDVYNIDRWQKPQKGALCLVFRVAAPPHESSLHVTLVTNRCFDGTMWFNEEWDEVNLNKKRKEKRTKWRSLRWIILRIDDGQWMSICAISRIYIYKKDGLKNKTLAITNSRNAQTLYIEIRCFWLEMRKFKPRV